MTQIAPAAVGGQRSGDLHHLLVRDGEAPHRPRNVDGDAEQRHLAVGVQRQLRVVEHETRARERQPADAVHPAKLEGRDEGGRIETVERRGTV